MPVDAWGGARRLAPLLRLVSLPTSLAFPFPFPFFLLLSLSPHSLPTLPATFSNPNLPCFSNVNPTSLSLHAFKWFSNGEESRVMREPSQRKRAQPRPMQVPRARAAPRKTL